MATAECHFGGGRGTVAYGPPPNNTLAVALSHRRSVIQQWPPCSGHCRNDIQRWPTFIMVTKAISLFRIFIHSKGHRLLHFSLMKPLFLDFHFLCHICHGNACNLFAPVVLLGPSGPWLCYPVTRLTHGIGTVVCMQMTVAGTVTQIASSNVWQVSRAL